MLSVKSGWSHWLNHAPVHKCQLVQIVFFCTKLFFLYLPLSNNSQNWTLLSSIKTNPISLSKNAFIAPCGSTCLSVVHDSDKLACLLYNRGVMLRNAMSGFCSITLTSCSPKFNSNNQYMLDNTFMLVTNPSNKLKMRTTWFIFSLC